jgi:lipid II:glycine glycyltransferase (peptidoglycan interpeptide bridge formation enzyme)
MNQVSSNVFKNHDFLVIPPNTKGHPSTFILKLKQPFEEEIWKKLWNGNLRNNIRKAKKNNVTILEDTSYQYEKEFIDMMHYHYQRFQTPLLKNEELKKRLHIFKNKTLLYVALHHNTPIAFLLCYYTPSTIYFSKLPHTYDARKYQTNALLCYHAIKQACEKGYQYIEFGITFNEYQARWKHKFKGKKIPLKQHQKQYSKIHCLCFDILDQLSWNIRNHKNIWNIKQTIIKKIIHLIK